MAQQTSADSSTGADTGLAPVAAAIMASAIGSLSLGGLVLLNELGLFTSPTLYAPAGGLSGRSTLAVVVWLTAWVGLSRMWRDKAMNFGHVLAVSFIMIGVSLFALLPAVWHALGA